VPNGVADDLSREAVAGVAWAGRCRHPARLPGSAASRKPVSRQVDGAVEAIAGLDLNDLANIEPPRG